jgi:hypothetical protein
MLRTSTLPRALAAALAIAAFSAQAAGAQPADLRSPDTQAAAAESQSRQDLRSPDAADAGNPREQRQDLRSPDTRPGPVLTAAPVTAPEPREIPASGGTDDGTPWALIAIGIAGAGALLTGTAAVTRRTRRRARVAA